MVSDHLQWLSPRGHLGLHSTHGTRKAPILNKTISLRPLLEQEGYHQGWFRLPQIINVLSQDWGQPEYQHPIPGARSKLQYLDFHSCSECSLIRAFKDRGVDCLCHSQLSKNLYLFRDFQGSCTQGDPPHWVQPPCRLEKSIVQGSKFFEPPSCHAGAACRQVCGDAAHFP